MGAKSISAATILLLSFLASSCPPSAWGNDGALQVNNIEEAGSRYLPASGTQARYITALSADVTLYEERNVNGIPSGSIVLLQMPTLANPGTTPTIINFWQAAGVPFFDPTLYHPCLFAMGNDRNTLGLYVQSDLPSGATHFFVSADGGLNWDFVSTPPQVQSLVGAGLFAAVTLDNPLHAEGYEVRFYVHDRFGSVSLLGSDSTATGLDKYADPQFLFGPSIVLSYALPDERYTPTGSVFQRPDGSFGFVFVNELDGYLGYASSPDGIFDWVLECGASNPLLSSASNPQFEDMARPNIHEVALVPAVGGFEAYFTAQVVGQPGTVGIGSLQLSFGPIFRRGDVNFDGNVNLTDALTTLQYLFLGQPLPCPDAADFNDSGSTSLLDPVQLIQFNFNSGPPPLPPFPNCGLDETLDTLPCDNVGVCL